MPGLGPPSTSTTPADGRPRVPTVGVFLPHDTEPGRMARLAERSGFDVLAAGEHVLFRRPILNAFVSLSAAAACTERIRLMSALTLLPLYPPAVAAKLASSLDFISGGRLDLGLGVGGEIPEEFVACGVEISRRGAHTDAAIKELLRYFDADNNVRAGAPDMLPKPVQQPTPPIWVGGRSEAALRRAARFAHGWLPYLMTPEQIRARGDVLRELRSDPIEIGAVVFVGVGTKHRQAVENATNHVSQLYGLDPQLVERFAIGGEASAVADRLSEFVAAGTSTLLLNLCAVGDAAEEMVALAADTLLPALRELRIREEAV